MIIKAVMILVFVGGSSLFACSFDTDCQVGSKCMKAAFSLYGSCVGGLAPGNANDTKPVTYPLDLTGARGNTCTWDTDCGVNGKCLKGNGSLRGTCF